MGGIQLNPNPKGPKYLYGTKYGFCSSNFPYGLGKYPPYGYLGPFGKHCHRNFLQRPFVSESGGSLLLVVCHQPGMQS